LCNNKKRTKIQACCVISNGTGNIARCLLVNYHLQPAANRLMPLSTPIVYADYMKLMLLLRKRWVTQSCYVDCFSILSAILRPYSNFVT